MEIEPMGTSQALVNTCRDIIIQALSLKKGGALYVPPEASLTDQFQRVNSIAGRIMALGPTTDMQAELHETPEAGAVS